MPWALFNRPSIQLGTLKAYLEDRNNTLEVKTRHAYLETASLIGMDLYQWISANPWVSEALYAPLVFPERTRSAEILAAKYVRKADAGIKRSFHFASLLATLKNQLEKWVEECDWTQYVLIGFSVCFHQLFSSLAAAKAIKQRHPEAIIVLGGSSCGAGAGLSLLHAFRFVDYVVSGEGEKALLALSEYISGQGASSLPGNILPQQAISHPTPQKDSDYSDMQLSSLVELPVPDYGEYFSELGKWFSQAPFIPVLPIEFSRGCWWNRCTFCNLNLQWGGYRHKDAARMLSEVKDLATRHACLDFSFVDNMLPPRAAEQLFGLTAADQNDFNFFAEIRSARTDRSPAEKFSIFRKGGLTTIQVGIEALSSTLLAKMQKGVSVIENVATMRAALENAIRLEGNLILHFPGSTSDEVAETLAVLDYVFPFTPLTGASFFLGYDSPVHNEPRKYGIKTIVNHKNYSRLFPAPVLKKVELLVKDYRGDRVYQRKLWGPVRRKIIKWQQFHQKNKQDTLHKPLLSYREGGAFLLVRQELPDGRVLHHRLRDAARQIYLFCTVIRTEKEILERFATIPPEKILPFLADLRKKKILFIDKNKYLALAIHARD